MITLGMFLSTPSIRSWKLAGQPKSPIGEVIHWYWPCPGIVNAVRVFHPAAPARNRKSDKELKIWWN